ncbi:hypothetical protein AFE02nite_07380 [Actinotalea fermentans]|uniref:Uncharacterized protein n=1 Tax=Actinotalea fermentans TaxID=43671 RepID=A0A511YUY4_9CELL|nr:hypothetical protein AFE02nite_07380 [Actinotalea fermentans]
MPAKAAARVPPQRLRSRLPPSPLEPAIDNDLQLIADGDGVAILGSSSAVERFLSSGGGAAVTASRCQ